MDIDDTPSIIPTESASRQSLRTRLVEIDEEMRLLTEERRRVIQGLDGIIYPVLTLPPEITTHIFSHCVYDPHIGHARVPGYGPLPLASVCRRWRDICLSTGALWASLRVYPARYSRGDIDNLIGLLRRWHSRAGNHPLDLRLFSSHYTSQIFSAISQYSHQWMALGLTLEMPFSFPNEVVWGRIPSLTTLVITVLNEPQDEPVMITAFRDAPSLREAELSGASLEWISLPWIQLARLELSDQSLSECVDILKETPNLEVLVVSHMFTLRLQTTPPVLLPKLHTLRFTYDPDGMLLNQLALPALETLELTALNRASRVLELGLRSAWPLRSIQLMNMTSDTTIACLRALPSSITAVHVHNDEWRPHDWDPLFELLANDDEFLPALCALTLAGLADGISTATLMGMLASRRNGTRQGVTNLESVRLLKGPETDGAPQRSRGLTRY
ncbi:hypothetical protein DFH09DRAFT_1199151 [Mycena vulgaris]|nr:hypothetical protein DFH09DRAFT_1199151 [Mycena vulgaris]